MKYCDIIFQKTPLHLLPHSSNTSNHTSNLSECDAHTLEQVRQEEQYTLINFI